MKSIPLTQGKVAVVDDDDYEVLVRYKWHAVKRKGGLWYAARNSGKRGNKELMHCAIVQATRGLHVDHRDGDGLNNVRNNLRPASYRQNHMNRRPNANTRCGFKGVWSTVEGKYQARLESNGQRFFLGTFDSQEDAARAYDTKATEVFGEFARLNFPKKEQSSHG